MQNRADWIITSTATLIQGFAYGSRHMTCRVSVKATALSGVQLNALLNWTGAQPEFSGDLSADAGDAESAVDLLLTMMRTVQQSLGFPLCEAGIRQSLGNQEFRLFIPLHRGAFVPVVNLLQFVVGLFNAAINKTLAGKSREDLKKILADLQRFAPKTGNVRAFMSAAYALDIPLHRLPGNACVYGQGKRARLLESSFTDKTSIIASQQARNKPVASEILRQYGLPVAVHQVVQDVRSALRAAEKIGYPVVIKPVDRDRGEGVSADLRTPAQVEKACQQAFSYSKNVMVEKHVDGKDYRITVMNGRVIWAVERVPGGVTGDGVSSVAGLLDKVNREPERSDHSRSPLKKIRLDDEALDMLQQAGLTPESVPEKGRFIVLRRSSNVTKGGMPVAVMDRVHPDNRRLAERAAHVLRLDIAGVDLLIPDISKSWRESGAAICEVNAQPTIGTFTASHLYGEILQNLLTNKGRIPVILVAGEQCAALSQSVASALSAAGYACGLYDGEQVHMNGEPMAAVAEDVFSAGRLLVMEPDAGAVVLALTDDSVVQRGLPFQRYDLLLLNGPEQAELTDMILPACDGHILALQRKPQDIPQQDPRWLACEHFNPQQMLELLGPESVCNE